MKLTFKQIISAANGIVRTEENDLGLELHRFTREQEGFFYKTHPLYCNESFFIGYFGSNCRTGAGITLDFISDAKKIRIKFGRIEESKSKTIKTHLFDLFADNTLVKSYEAKCDLEEILYESTGEKKHFTLYFPYYSFAVISSMELEDATVFLPQKKNVDILFLGDSITHGARASHPSASYVTRVAKALDVGIINQGNSGFVYDAGSIDKVCDPEVIVTAYGINDFMKKDLLLLERETTEFLKRLREVYTGSKIVSILPIWTHWDSEDENFKRNERDCLERVYEKYSDYIIDGHKLVPHDAKYFDDGVHPNDEGFEFYGNNLALELKKILRGAK